MTPQGPPSRLQAAAGSRALAALPHSALGRTFALVGYGFVHV